MVLTLILSLIGCVSLSLAVWGLTVTMPTALLASNFPVDVQVCLDYILLTKTQFFQHYFPETKNCIGWKQFGYNRKQQIRQCIIIPVCCLIGALILTFI